MKHESRSLLNLPWAFTDTIISGRPASRLDRLAFHTLEEARGFLHNYGCDHGGETDCMSSLRQESLAFIEDRLFRDEPGLVFPAEIRETKEICRLLLWASAPRSDPRQPWACLLVRVMHAFSQCDSFFKDTFGPQIREQIYGRFAQHVHPTDDGFELRCGGQSVPLADFQTRGPKTREAIATKLLRKGGNATTDLFDWVGMRFVTKERFDAILVVRYLRTHNLVLFAHIRPDRSRNTLLDVERLKADMRQVHSGPEEERLQELRRRVQTYPFPDPPARSDNPFSSHAYHSIQFTCHQMIVVAPSVQLQETIPTHPCPATIRFQYPYEVQIMDEASYRMAHTGEASHEVYKERQRRELKKLLLRNLPRPVPASCE